VDVRCRGVRSDFVRQPETRDCCPE
jgi:hypothetical protein